MQRPNPFSIMTSDKRRQDSSNNDKAAAAAFLFRADMLELESEILKFESEIDQDLKEFRKLQKQQYQLAEEKLREHVKYIQNLLQQLDKEESELASIPNASHSNELFQTVEKLKTELRQGMIKYEEMKQISNGFASTSKTILEKHFGYTAQDI